MPALTDLQEFWADETLTGQGQNQDQNQNQDQGAQALSNATPAPSAPFTPCKALSFFALVRNVFIFLMIVEVILLLLILYEVMKRWPASRNFRSTS